MVSFWVVFGFGSAEECVEVGVRMGACEWSDGAVGW